MITCSGFSILNAIVNRRVKGGNESGENSPPGLESPEQNRELELSISQV